MRRGCGTDYALDDSGHKIVMTGDSSNPAYCGKTMTDEYGKTYTNALCTAKAGKASDSICPKGWKAAEHDGSGSYQNLVSVYNFATNSDAIIHPAPLSLVRAGYYDNYYLNRKGTAGNYLETQVALSNSVHSVFFNAYELRIGNSADKGDGFSLRCLVR